MTDERRPDPLALPPEDIEALKAHRRKLDQDIETGQMRPGERRCVTLPSGSRFYLEHPEAEREAADGEPWWTRLARGAKALLR